MSPYACPGRRDSGEGAAEDIPRELCENGEHRQREPDQSTDDTRAHDAREPAHPEVPTTHPCHAPTVEPGRGGGGEQRRAGRDQQRRPRVDQPFVAPAVSPPTMYFCRKRNSTMTGIAAMTAPAEKADQSA